MLSIYNLSYDELVSYLEQIHEKKYRATQIYEWLYRFRVSSFLEMSNLSTKLIEILTNNFTMSNLELITKEVSKDGTIKYLFGLEDGRMIETVLMRHNYGNSLCVTSQVGCNMGCAFCASGELGKVRDLTLSEMVLQVLMVQKELDLTYERISNVVVMGIGEPFDNYETVLKFLKVINYPKGLEIGARHITVSTCGIVPKIKEFASFDLQVNLAISLHAPNDELRSQIMKINRRYPIKDIIDALDYYFQKTNRRVTFEYILLKGVNDSVENAKELVRLINHSKEVGKCCYVNLIPYNEVDTKEFKTTPLDVAQKFFKVLYDNNIQVTLRMEHGRDISAACGQLRAQKEMLKK